MFASSTVPVPLEETLQVVILIPFYVTIASTGNATNFGDLLTDARRRLSGQGFSNQTRGLICGGWKSPANYDVIEYITIASTGNAVDFGDLTRTAREFIGTCASPTRGVIGGGDPWWFFDTVEFRNTMQH